MTRLRIIGFVFAILISMLLFGCVGEGAPPKDDVTPPPDDVYPPPPPPKTNVTNITNVSKCAWTAPTQDGKLKALSYQTDVSVDAVAISKYGYRAVAGGQDYYVYYFRQGEEKPYFTYETEGQVNSVAISDDGQTFVAGSYDGEVYLFDCDESTPAWTYDTGEDDAQSPTVEGVDISSDGKWVAAVSKSHVYVFDRMNSTPVFKLDLSNRTWRLATVKISKDGYHLVAGTIPDGTNGKVFYITAQGRLKGFFWEYPITDLRWAGGVPVAVDISEDGNYIASGGPDNQVHFWESSSSTPKWTYKIANESAVYSVSLSEDGSKLAATGDFKLFYFQDTEHGTPSWVNDGTYFDPQNESRSDYWGIGNYLDAVDLSEDGSDIAVGDYVYGHFFTFQDGSNETMEMYDLKYGEDSVGAVDVSSDGSWVIASSTFYGEILRVRIG